MLILVAAVQMYALFTFTMFHVILYPFDFYTLTFNTFKIRRIKEQRHLAGIGRRSAAGGKSSHGKKKSKSDEVSIYPHCLMSYFHNKEKFRAPKSTIDHN